MTLRWATVATALIGALTALAPLAYATPQDSTWISGWWDDADHDDIISRITSDVGAIEPHHAPDGGPVRAVVAALPQGDERRACSRVGSSPPARAPPAS